MNKSYQRDHLEQVKELYSRIDSQFFPKVKDFFKQIKEIPSWNEFVEGHVDHHFLMTEKKRHIHNQPIKDWDDQTICCLNYVCLFYCLNNKVHPLQMNKSQWSEIGSCYQNLHWKVTRSKWLNQQSYSIVDQPWSREEDQALQNIQSKMIKQGKYNKWRQVSLELCKSCQTTYVRLGKQCRERWINKLNPEIDKGPWYKDEEMLLFEAVAQEGKKWSKISAIYFQYKRSENYLKNRFYSMFKRESLKISESLKQQFEPTESNVINSILTKLQTLTVLKKSLYLAQLKHIEQPDFENLFKEELSLVIIKKSKFNKI